MTDLIQGWPAPANPKPIVIVGAGGIVRDAHMPAYRMAGLTVTGVTDTDADRASRSSRRATRHKPARPTERRRRQWQGPAAWPGTVAR